MLKLIKSIKCECPDLPEAKITKTSSYYKLARSFDIDPDDMRGRLVGFITMGAKPADLKRFTAALKAAQAAAPAAKRPRAAAKAPKRGVKKR